MIPLLCAISILAADVPWQYTATEIFSPLNSNEVAIGDQGQSFILDFQEARIHLVDTQGQLVKSFGRKGEGPGEFTYATQFFFTEGKLFLFDLLSSSVSEFDGQGNYLNRYTLPYRHLVLAKVKGGWVYGYWDSFNPDIKPHIGVAGENFADAKQLFEVKEPGWNGGTMAWSDGSQFIVQFNPFTNRPNLQVSKDRDKVLISDTQDFKFQVLDVASQKMLDVRELEVKKFPFDEEWLEGELDKTKASLKERGRPTNNIQTERPDYFPAIRSITRDPDGYLAVDRWRGRPDDNHHLVTVTEDIKEVPTKWTWELLSRFVGMHGDYLYITVFDSENETGGIARVHRDQAEEFVKDHPIEFDGEKSRTISISN